MPRFPPRPHFHASRLGAIDGMHVRIKAPGNSCSLFYNYNQYFSLVLLAVANARSRIIYFHMGSYGHECDAGIFDRCDFARRMRAGQLSLPPPTRLPRSDKVLSHFFVGNGAFPLSTTLMKPFPMRDLNPAQRIYNYKCARTSHLKFHLNKNFQAQQGTAHRRDDLRHHGRTVPHPPAPHRVETRLR